MNCPHCGNPVSGTESFCSVCGAPQAAQQPQPPVQQLQQPVGLTLRQLLARLFTEPLFLTMCILESVSVAAAIFLNGIFSLGNIVPHVPGVLFVIFLWMLYAQSRKGDADPKSMRYISGTCFAVYIVNWVSAGALMLSGLLLCAVSGALSGFMDTVMDAVLGSVSGINTVLDVFKLTGTALFVVIGIMALLTGVVTMLLNLFGYRNIHRFAQSAYRSAESGVWQPVQLKTAHTWLMVYGILQAIGALSSLGSLSGLLGSGCGAAALIVASLWLRKHFPDNANIC